MLINVLKAMQPADGVPVFKPTVFKHINILSVIRKI